MRSGAGRAGWPILQGVTVPLFALSAVARSGATRSNYHSSKIFLSIAGTQYGTGRADLATGVLDHSLSVSDTLNDAPNTASCTVRGLTPALGAEVIITLGSKNNLVREFGGQLLRASHASLTNDAANDVWALSLIDFTWGLGKRLVSGYFTGSATTIAQSLIATATGYTASVEAGLPTVDGGITFTMTELPAALTQLCKRAGLNWFCDYRKVVRVFTELVGETPPVILNAVHRSLSGFSHTRDLSQMITRVLVEGGGGAAFASVAVGETIFPVTVGDWYELLGGVVVAGPQRISYTSRSLGGGGGLVGPGAAPTGVPVLALVSGSGVESGAHNYAVTHVTASGESLPSPIAAITVGPIAAPATAPTAGASTIGSGPDAGSHEYALTFVTGSGETTAGPRVTAATSGTSAPASAPTPGTPTLGGSVTAGSHEYAVSFVTPTGETVPGPISGSVTAFTLAPPSSIGDASESPSGSGTGNLDANATYRYRSTFGSGASETTPGPESNAFMTGAFIRMGLLTRDGNPAAPPGFDLRFYRTEGGGSAYKRMPGGHEGFSSSDSNYYRDTLNDGTLGAAVPSTNTAIYGTIALAGIPIGDANVTARKLYRRSGGAGLRLVTTIGNNSQTTYTDTMANGSLGAAPLSTSTATVQRIPLSNLALGGPLVTSRKLYGTPTGSTQLKFIATLNLTDTTYLVTTTDAGLGANVPTSNTATANQVGLTGIPIGAAAVTSRKLYRTPIGSTQLKLLATIPNNTATTHADSAADASLGANVPVVDASGLQQPAGQVLAGSTSLVVAGTGAFSPGGGWAVIGNGEQVIRYTGVTGSSLTGIPALGPGAVVASIGYNSTVTASPALLGVPTSGPGSILYPVLKGDDVNLLETVDDVAAQAALAGFIGGDGIQETYVQDRRLAKAEARARGTAVLALKSSVDVAISFDTRDLNARSGRTQAVNLGPPFNLTAEFLIQSVTETFLQTQPQIPPTFHVEASSQRLTFEQLLQRPQGM